jgi:hypothetical protein
MYASLKESLRTHCETLNTCISLSQLKVDVFYSVDDFISAENS